MQYRSITGKEVYVFPKKGNMQKKSKKFLHNDLQGFALHKAYERIVR